MLRVGVIGCGHIATTGHLPAFVRAAQAGACTLVGVCDIDPERAETVARQYGVSAFDSAGALLARVRPDVVSIATLPSNHRELVVQVLDSGCHVLCEKPVAMHAGEAEEMVVAAERAGRLLSICFEYRYWDEATYMRQRIAAGDLGHVHSVRTWGGRVNGYPSDKRRHNVASAGGGVLAHWTIHNIDLALWLLGGPEPLRATAFCSQQAARRPAGVEPGIEDFAVGMIQLEGGTVVTVEANWLQPPSSRPEGFELLGDRGAASISPLRIWLDRDGKWVDGTPPPGTLAPCDYDMSRLIAGFLQRVAEGGPAPVSGPEILRIQRLMDALYESAASGREVPVGRWRDR